MRCAYALLFTLTACSTPAPTRVSIDVSRLAQTSMPVQSVGLLVVSSPLADAAAQQTRAESAEGEVISTSAPAPPPSTTKTNTISIGETNPNMDTGARRAADAPGETKTAAVATPEVEKTDEVRSPFAYFPITLEPGARSFSVDVPSGPSQSLFLYGFGAPDAKSGTPVPTYAAAAVNVKLEAGAEQDLTFIAYPAGVIAPQILAPSLIGLTDAAGTAITAAPETLSCLAVARAAAPREGFPADLTIKIRVGSLDAAAAIGSASVLVVPVGDYQLSCYAQFASKLFAVNPPIDVKVEQGRVTVATGALVKIKDLTPSVTGPGTTPGIVPPPGETGTDPGTNPPTLAAAPRFSVHIGTAGGTSAGPLGGPPESEPGQESNFDTASGDQLITVIARHPDGSLNAGFDGVVALRVTPAIDRTLVGNDVAGGPWRPFGGTPPFEQRVFIVGGMGSLKQGLRLSGLLVPQLGDRATMQFVMTAQPLDASGALTRAAGAKLFTVRSDLGCRGPLAFSSWFAGTVTTEPNELTLFFDAFKQSYRPQVDHLLVAGLTERTGTNAPSRCVFMPSQQPLVATGATLYLLPKDKGSRDMLQLSSAFFPTALPMFSGQQGFAVNVANDNSGQAVLFDAISPVLPPGMFPPVGTRLEGLGYAVYDDNDTAATTPPQFNLTAVVK